MMHRESCGAAEKAWACEICGEVVVWQVNGKPVHPIEVYETCKLKAHYVGDECIAYRDLLRAKELARTP